MRRASTLASFPLLSRSLANAHGGAAPTSAPASYGLFQVALYGTSTTTGPHVRRRRFDSFFSGPARNLVIGVAGTLASVAVATSLTQEVYAKEPPPAELLPKEVVLSWKYNCRYCIIVTAYLDFHDTPYKIVKVGPFDYNNKRVPTLMVDGDQLVGSSAKISSTEKFKFIVVHGGMTRKMIVVFGGAMAAALMTHKMIEILETSERASLYEAAETWVDALNGQDFLGGSKPNLADLAVFGVLRPIRYLRSGEDMVEDTSIGEWYSRMERAVGEPATVEA